MVWKMAASPDVGGETYKLTLDGAGVQIAKSIDGNTAASVIALVMGGVGMAVQAPPIGQQLRGGAAASRRRAKRKTDGAPPKAGRSPSLGIAKDLSLRPRGKKAFVDFVSEKQPKTHAEKHAVIVFWLRHEAGYDSGIGIEHVNSCYQGVGWKRPRDLRNSLALTSSRKGWVDTSDLANIGLTTPGEDYVIHDLPGTEG
jgi:hypothetical protein